MDAKRQIMTRSQLEKMDSEQLVQSFLLMQDDILGNQSELLQQNNIVNERLEDLSKKFQDLLNENNIKSILAVAENTSGLLKSNTKKLKKHLIYVLRSQCKSEQYSRRECIENQGILQNVSIKSLEDTTIKIFENIGISINKLMIVACHRLGKTTKTTVKFANRKELVLKSKKKAKRYKFPTNL